MSDDVLETVQLRTDFYKDGYRKLATIVLVLGIANILMVFALLSTYSKPDEVRFFATSSDGRIIPVQPLNLPGKTSAEIIDWSVRAATKVYSYDYVNYRDDLRSVSSMFTGKGWQSFQETLTRSRTLKTVVAEKLVMNAEPTGAASILEQGVLDNRYTWKVQVPILVRMQGNTEMRIPVLVTLLVQRVSLVDNPEGIGIIQMIISEGT
ncbi:type IVB secretion system apparatus protein IcmL/DotI [Gammaproteobacteria bacterium]|nr:type IVB secretion system apparatus protein IcmL/DotI [Gammaproteobacteria bacterium]